MKATPKSLFNQTTTVKVSLEEAVESIAYYKQVMIDNLGLTDGQILKAFAVKHDDIFECLGIADTVVSEYSHFRIYFGMTVPAGVGLGPNDMRLFLVPVVKDEDGNDIDVIPTCPPSTQFPSGQFVYDFNTPCPNTCDGDSPLFLA
ncbi:MAG: hypothetical protein M3R17_17230 [Bacteroidota bacterium]|nr:hypothetical protein [Bacteroidota bacterium]